MKKCEQALLLPDTREEPDAYPLPHKHTPALALSDRNTHKHTKHSRIHSVRSTTFILHQLESHTKHRQWRTKSTRQGSGVSDINCW